MSPSSSNAKRRTQPYRTLSAARNLKSRRQRTAEDWFARGNVAAGDDGRCNAIAITPILRLSVTIRTNTMRRTTRSRSARPDARTLLVAGSTSRSEATNILVAARFAIYGNKESSIATKSTRGSARSGVQIQELTRLISGSTGKLIQRNLSATRRTGRPRKSRKQRPEIFQPIFLPTRRHAMPSDNLRITKMRKRRSWRVTPDAATEHAVEDLARRDSRPVANMCLALIKAGLEQRRAQQRAVSERTEPQS